MVTTCWDPPAGLLKRSGRLKVWLITPGVFTQRLYRLVEVGLVGGGSDPPPRRGTLVRLTRRGKTTIDKALEAHLTNEEALLRSLSAADRRALDSLLRTLLAEVESR